MFGVGLEALSNAGYYIKENDRLKKEIANLKLQLEQVNSALRSVNAKHNAAIDKVLDYQNENAYLRSRINRYHSPKNDDSHVKSFEEKLREVYPKSGS